jgi:NAD(P)-dependent dehydrogenase (short-subunit alcohol dehydrogenase family)
VARSRTRAEAVLERLRQRGAGIDHSVFYADLSLLGEMKRVAGEIAEAEPRIDVLINNAGGLYEKRKLTSEGLERTFATNHMSYFAVTLLLRDRLQAAAPSRVVNIASEAHRRRKLDLDDLLSSRNYSGFGAYSRSKLCNILFTRELARRWTGTGITVNCLHPGFVNTRLGDDGRGVFAYGFWLAKKFAITPQEGAETIVFLASSEEVADVTGKYFDQCRPKTPSNDAVDDDGARRLWEISEALLSGGGGL